MCFMKLDRLLFSALFSLFVMTGLELVEDRREGFVELRRTTLVISYPRTLLETNCKFPEDFRKIQEDLLLV